MSGGRDVKEVYNYNNTGLLRWEELNLDIDGSGAGGVAVPPTLTFDIISRVILSLRFDTATLNWDVFAADAGALTNGVDLEYNGTSIANIKNNGDFYKYGYDVDFVKDEVGTPSRIITARWSFFKSVPRGVSVHAGDTLKFRVNDDMTAVTSITSFVGVMQGFEAHD
jgi:hypothetical protein